MAIHCIQVCLWAEDLRGSEMTARRGNNQCSLVNTVIRNMFDCLLDDGEISILLSKRLLILRPEGQKERQMSISRIVSLFRCE